MGQLFLVMLNLRPKNFSEFFHLHSALDSEFYTRGSGHQLFIGHTIFEVKTFFRNF